MRYRLKAGEVFTDALVEALDDPNLENKLMTLGIIRGLADKARKASPKVIAMSLDPDVKIRIQAVGALSAFPVSVDVFEAIGRSLKDPEKQVRLAAAGALRRVGPADPMKTAELLRAALDVERDDTARRALSSALESVQNPPKASGPRSSSK
jgi:HEAT repeat protein